MDLLDKIDISDMVTPLPPVTKKPWGKPEGEDA
jgi:hypothetical protein